MVWDDGRVEPLTLHEYARVYAIPGLYEEVVQRRLGCRTPERVAALLAEAAGGAALRVLDAGAGNGVSGDALAAAGLDPVVGLDLEPAARDAVLRDRPGRYGAYLIADLTALAPAEEAAIRAARPQALACIGSVGGDHLPPAAVVAGLALLEAPALLAYAYDVAYGADPLADVLDPAGELARDRYVHRRTVTGGERVWVAVVTQAGLRALPKSG